MLKHFKPKIKRDQMRVIQTYAPRWLAVVTILVCLAVSMSFAGPVAADDNRGEPVVVTMWWVIFNYPENCSDNSCGANDLVDAPDLVDDKKIKTSVVYGTGQVTDEEGRVMLVSSLYPTDTDFGGPGPAPFSDGLLRPFGKGLLNIAGAEIHLVMRSHGPVIDEHVDEQLTSLIDSGCQAKGGPNECRYILGAVHLPGQETADVIVFGKPDQVIEGASSIIFSDDNGLKAIVRTIVDLESEDDN